MIVRECNYTNHLLALYKSFKGNTYYKQLQARDTNQPQGRLLREEQCSLREKNRRHHKKRNKVPNVESRERVINTPIYTRIHSYRYTRGDNLHNDCDRQSSASTNEQSKPSARCLVRVCVCCYSTIEHTCIKCCLLFHSNLSAHLTIHSPTCLVIFTFVGFLY